MKSILELSPEQLRKAAQIKDQIVALENQLQGLLGEGGATSSSAGGMSAARRAQISAAMKARWARVKTGKAAKSQSAQTNSGAKKKKPMSAAQKAQIAERMRAHWAKIRAGKK